MLGISGKLGRRNVAARPRTTLGRLARDVRGNTLAIMAAALIPFCGLVGGGIDVSRMYITKTRLQHACDAGALAGRKRMGAGNWTADGNAADAAARQYFLANYDGNGMYGGGQPTLAFAESAGKVTGTASATLPMTLMRVLGKTEETLSVTCDAEMRLPNTDVMFVLDTTGSMTAAQPGDTVSKMDALKTSVKCFYEIVARLDTNATCTTGTPSGGTGNQVQVRFGFMPYATNVNVGKLLPTSYFADSWKYQTRQANKNTPGWQLQSQRELYRGFPTYYNTQAECDAIGAGGWNSSSDVLSSDGNTKTTTANVYTVRSYTVSTRACAVRHVKTEYVYRKIMTFTNWTYDKLPVTVGLLKNGTAWRNSFEWPIGTDGASRTITWDGCIEERQTVPATNYSPIPSGAKDLNIDLVPNQTDATTLWAPALPELIYLRQIVDDAKQINRAAITTTLNYYNVVPYSCSTEARKLQQWPSADLFAGYVDSLQPSGNTYHDIGLIWGARFASPTGIFASDNARTPQGGEIERHIIFMTDGDACTSPGDYGPYGMHFFDRRQTDDAAIPTGGCTFNSYTLTQQVNLRTEAMCAAIKNKNLTLWVIAFGDLATETETRLASCATPGRYFKATSAATLQSTFKSIADQISQLRLTR